MSKGVRTGIGILATILAAVFICATSAEAQTDGVVFGIKPSVLPIQSAFIGYSTGQFEPYVGLDLISVKLDETSRWGWDEYWEEHRDKVSARVLIPHFGAKYYFKSDRTEGTVSPYVLGAFLFSLASVDGGEDVDVEEEEYMKGILQFWGLSAAFGAQYSFSDRFAFGGEFGVRYLRDSAKESGDARLADEVSIVLAATYAVLTLNFRI